MEESTKVDGFDKPRVVDNRGRNAVKCKFKSTVHMEEVIFVRTLLLKLIIYSVQCSPYFHPSPDWFLATAFQIVPVPVQSLSCV